MSEDTITRCEGVFRCGTMETHCRKHATLRRCGKYFCDGCARWNRHTMDTRDAPRCPQHDTQECSPEFPRNLNRVTNLVTSGDNNCHPHETPENKPNPTDT